MPLISRGFRGRQSEGPSDRIPPGQHLVDDFPVLSAGPTPHTPLEEWTFTIEGGAEPVSWTWEEFRALPSEEVTTDIHCVTKWSKLDTVWRGVSLDTLLGLVEHDAGYLLAFCDGGYTTNLPLEHVTDGKAWIAYDYGGEPLEPEHGGPARMLVPHLYFWKSAKWIRGFRLQAEDGYQAERSYSIASEPGGPLAITVERLENGEVSPYLVEEAREGDGFEVRGPIGGYFVWEDDGRPIFLVGGGSGVVPLMAMIRSSSGTTPIRLLYSSRALEDVIYRQELEDRAGHGLEVFHTLTREQPPGWTGYSRRIDSDLLREVAWQAAEQPHVFICGSTRFVDAAADGLVRLGYPPLSIRTERFGATGG